MVIGQFIELAAALTGFALLIVLAGLLLVYRHLKASFNRRSEELITADRRLRAESEERRSRERDLAATREELEREKQFFEELFLQSTVAMQIFDRQGNRLRVNDEWYRLFDRRGSSFGDRYNVFEDPAIRSAGLDVGLRRVISEGITAEWEAPLEYRQVPGPPRWFRIRAYPVSGRAGEVAYMIVHSEDVTERRRTAEVTARSLREKEILLKEVHHRVKNNMQLMKSILTLQAGTVSDPATLAMFTESANRINAMALIHEKLYQNDTLGTVSIREYLAYIADRIYQTYTTPQHDILIKTELDDVELDIDTAVPCGLLANELISNALKHAFEDRAHGTVLLSFRTLDHSVGASGPAGGPSGPAPAYLLGVTDNGCGIPEPDEGRDSNSLGLKLVSSLVKQLNGELEVSDGPRSGTVVEVRFPLSKGTHSPSNGV